jgi:hypothetical protein
MALGHRPVRSPERDRRACRIARYGPGTVTVGERDDPGHQALGRNFHPATAPGRGILHYAPPSVTLHDPGSEAAHGQVITAIERAVGTVPEQGFPIDVTFPGEGEPDQVDEWISVYAELFYIRT